MAADHYLIYKVIVIGGVSYKEVYRVQKNTQSMNACLQSKDLDIGDIVISVDAILLQEEGASFYGACGFCGG